MHDEPHGHALLAEARRALLDEVAPGLSGRPRFVALMVANAVGVVMRELEGEDERAAAWGRLRAAGGASDSAATLARAIREGRHDADADLYAALVETAGIAARIWKPDSGAR